MLTNALTSDIGYSVVLWSTIALLLVVAALMGLVIAVRARNIVRARHWTELEQNWEPILLEVLAGDRTTSDLSSLVPERHRLHFLRYLVRYSRILAGASLTTVRELAAPHLGVLESRVRSYSAARRAHAILVLSTLSPEEDAVVDALGDRSPLVAMIAARSLAAHGRTDAIERILDNLYRFRGWNNRYLASMLADMGTEIAPALRAFLIGAGTDRERVVAAEALRILLDSLSAETAAIVLSTSDDVDLLVACQRLIRGVGGSEHLPFVRLLIDHPHFAVRAHAIQVLGSIGEPEDHDTLARSISDDSPWVALHAARALLECRREDLLLEIIDHRDGRSLIAREVLEEVA